MENQKPIVKIKRRYQLEDALDELGYIINIDDEIVYKHLPYWFEFDEQGIILHHVNDLPIDIINHLDLPLTKEDIESLGWFSVLVEEGNYYFWDIKTKDHSILYSFENKRCIITIHDYDSGEDHTAFVGTIKSKRELEVLLKQIGV